MVMGAGEIVLDGIISPSQGHVTNAIVFSVYKTANP
jgi:hypothetical protein